MMDQDLRSVLLFILVVFLSENNNFAHGKSLGKREIGMENKYDNGAAQFNDLYLLSESNYERLKKDPRSVDNTENITEPDNCCNIALLSPSKNRGNVKFVERLPMEQDIPENLNDNNDVDFSQFNERGK